MFKSLSLLLLLQAASAMQVRVHNMTCQQYSISVEFDRLCTNESVCTIGKSANIEGTLNYHYLKEQFNMNEYTSVYLDLNMSLFGRDAVRNQDFSSYKPVYEGTFLDFAKVPICSNGTMTPTEDGLECPSTGKYNFATGIKLPHPDNAFQSWMWTGFDGLAHLAIYRSEEYNSDLLGSCTFHISTEQEHDGRLGNLPSGKPVHEAVIAFIAVFLWLAVFGFCCLTRHQNRKNAASEQLQKVPPPFVPEDRVEGRFRRMEEETEEEQNRNFGFRYVPTDAFRYVPPEDEPTPPTTFERVMCIA